jgi:CheY-like chemotaxis protein
MQDPKASILIVEDDDSVRRSFVDVFTALGYSARSARDGIDAIIEMRQGPPDILLSDLNMIGMSGFELLSVVRRRFPSVHVVAMSGMFSGDEVPCGVAADAFYQKGNGIPALLKVIEGRPLSRRRQHDSDEPLLWIQRNGHDASGCEFVTIACPECFRTFPQPIRGKFSQILDTQCIFCTSRILYAVVEPNSPVFPQPWRHASNGAPIAPLT